MLYFTEDSLPLKIVQKSGYRKCELLGNNMRKRILILVLTSLVMLPLTVFAAKARQSSAYYYLSKLSQSELMEEGVRYAQNLNKPDSAVLCFTIVINRYDNNASREEKQTIIKACTNLWNVYFLNFNDYANCLRWLYRAEEIAQEAHIDDPRIDMSYGITYQTMSNLSDDKSLNSKSQAHYRKAFWTSLRAKDYLALDISYGNLIDVSYTLGQLNNVVSESKAYLTVKGHDSQLRKYNIKLKQGLDMMSNGKYNEAIAYFKEQLENLSENEGNTSILFSLFSNLSESYELNGQYEKAIGVMRRAENLAEKYQMEDGLVEVYRSLSNLYKKKGDLASSGKYGLKFIKLKDQLLNYQQIKVASNLKFEREMSKVNEKMQQMKEKRKIEHLVMLGTIVFTVIVVVLLFFLYSRNKALRESNRQLYLKNEELLKLDSPISHKPHSETQYKSIDSEKKADLIERIKTVMADTKTICTPGFTIEQLTQIIESKNKLVSQIINETYGCNFNTLLSNTRIKEACRRMADKEHYGNYTIEALGKSVGFKSRSNFITAFKRVTGLTPSLYMRLSKEGKSE